MRLIHIKLAGFKSFVDLTAFAVQSSLVGVVGPNGCGKSNIIDAVRWVLGESKASELRGESMQDVIFNGSTNRKPASRASVELVFNNDESRAGGHWNQFSEISVKRVLTRDGTSSYYINQQVVRRRDVQDIFLGTGLGPKAYAIIGQGMITRIIEARPEELRVFLEEAAGVSKYKERRKETQSRLQDTRNNLTRVEDISRELNNNIERLSRQAEIARQYRELETQRNTKQRHLWSLRYQEGVNEKNRCAAMMEAARSEIEGLNAQSVQAQTELLLMRQAQLQAQQALGTEQHAFIQTNQSVSQLEADIRVMAEVCQRLKVRVVELQAQQEQWNTRKQKANEAGISLQFDIAVANTKFEQAQVHLIELQTNLMPAQKALEQTRYEHDQARMAVIGLEQELKSLAHRRESVVRQMQQVQQRRERLQQELNGFSNIDPVELENVQKTYVELESEQQKLAEQKQVLANDFQQAKAALELADQTANREQDQWVAVQARLSALQQLHQQILANDQLAPWLVANGLETQERLLAKVRVEQGWEKALEAVLRERLNALIVSDLSSVSGFAVNPPSGKLAFLAPSKHPTTSNGLAQYLFARIQCSDSFLKGSLECFLSGVLLAETLELAISRRSSLQSGECWVTREGHMVGQEWVLFYAESDEQAGALARLQEIDNLQRQEKALQLLATQSQSQKISARAFLEAIEQRMQALDYRLTSVTKQTHEAQIRVLQLSEIAQRRRQRIEQINADTDLIDDELQTLRIQEEELIGAFEVTDEILANKAEFHIGCEDQLRLAQEHLAKQQANIGAAEMSMREADFAHRELQTQQAQYARDVELAQQQLQASGQTLLQTQQELEQQNDEQLRALLEDALERRFCCEQSLAQARMNLDQISEKVRQAEILDRESNKKAQPIRDRLQELGLKEQAARLQIEQFQTLIEQANLKIPDVLAELAGLSAQAVLPKSAQLQSEVTYLSQAMVGLGSVNLAALEELEAASERKLFLDQQTTDLMQAIETLVDAIGKIDRETRELLQETFGIVNTHFSQLFPQLFGGGEARLVMSGDEILDAGVQVFAQPPGKKNSTIHLLSGGEKALTATALVFAMFQLNPAPFCLLDEVDAPLDDANTERFSRLVRRMSEQTQFLFISHNKIAMEMAQQLIGVTMQEQGVSRIVAVDLESAVKLATETA